VKLAPTVGRTGVPTAPDGDHNPLPSAGLHADRCRGLSEPPPPSNSPMRSWTGRRRKADGLPRRSMKDTDFSPIPYSRIFIASGRGWCSRPPWPRSRRRNPSYRPHLPAAVIAEGLLSDAQLRKRDRTPARPMPAISPDHGSSMRLSTSFPQRPTARTRPSAPQEAGFSATAPGAGKGRQVAGILLTTG